MNQLLLDITTNIQQYQQYGVPFWISSADNGGSSFPYAQWALASYGGIVYESQVASNVSTPGTDPNWLQLSANYNGVQPGVVIDYAGYSGVVVPGVPIPNLPGYFLCDGTAISRSTYLNLREAITITQTGTTTNTMSTISGLTDTSDMYIGMPIEGTNIPLSTTVATIVDANNITISNPATGSGSGTLVFFPWGNGDNATTFNLPDLRRKTTAGKFGTGSTTLGNKVGQSGGEEAHTMTTDELVHHSHNATSAQQFLTTGSGFLYGAGTNGGQLSGTTANSTGAQNAFNVVQPTAIVNKAIKY
jgi:hypothetical protein